MSCPKSMQESKRKPFTKGTRSPLSKNSLRSHTVPAIYSQASSRPILDTTPSTITPCLQQSIPQYAVTQSTTAKLPLEAPSPQDSTSSSPCTGTSTYPLAPVLRRSYKEAPQFQPHAPSTPQEQQAYQLMIQSNRQLEVKQ